RLGGRQHELYPEVQQVDVSHGDDDVAAHHHSLVEYTVEELAERDALLIEQRIFRERLRRRSFMRLVHRFPPLFLSFPGTAAPPARKLLRDRPADRRAR